MANRRKFAQGIAQLNLKHVERAIALLWYYRQTQEYDERSASELAKDLQEEGFPKPNVSHLKESLQRSKYAVQGKQKHTFQLDLRRIPALDQRYKGLLKLKTYEPKDNIIPSDWVKGKRVYLEKLVNEINTSYELGLYDCCAVICRRLMESLIIEVYISSKRHQEIQSNKVFFMLEKLISYVCSDRNIILSRNTPKTMQAIKDVGDTAAHDRFYITQQADINDLKSKYRHLIKELLVLSKINN
jgi:hypothetical protein